MKFSIRQKKAINATENKILVCSSAGSGKTTVLTKRIEKLLKENIPAKDIVAITFTNLAAEEMRNRLGEKAKNMFIGTIHSYANYICNLNGIYNDKEINEKDFDAILTKAIKIDVAKYPKIQHLFVDEFQDTGELDKNFLFKIPTDNQFFVGDMRQQIYSFRNKGDSAFIECYNDLSYKKYNLSEDYRNPIKILDFANLFVKKIYQTGATAIPVKQEQGIVITDMLFRDIVEEELLEQSNYIDWYILCRTNAEVDEAIDILGNFGIPAVTFKLGDFESQEELKAQMSVNCVKVLTVHGSKGLSLPNVIAIGCKVFNNEEKRISYVAATRASEQLFWCPSIASGKKKNKRRNVSNSGFEEWT